MHRTPTDEKIDQHRRSTEESIRVWNKAIDAGVIFMYDPTYDTMLDFNVNYDNFNISDYKTLDEANKEKQNLSRLIEFHSKHLNVIAEYHHYLKKVAKLRSHPTLNGFLRIPRICELLKECRDEIPKILNPSLQ